MRMIACHVTAAAALSHAFPVVLSAQLTVLFHVYLRSTCEDASDALSAHAVCRQDAQHTSNPADTFSVPFLVLAQTSPTRRFEAACGFPRLHKDYAVIGR